MVERSSGVLKYMKTLGGWVGGEGEGGGGRGAGHQTGWVEMIKCRWLLPTHPPTTPYNPPTLPDSPSHTRPSSCQDAPAPPPSAREGRRFERSTRRHRSHCRRRRRRRRSPSLQAARSPPLPAAPPSARPLSARGTGGTAAPGGTPAGGSWTSFPAPSHHMQLACGAPARCGAPGCLCVCVGGGVVCCMLWHCSVWGVSCGNGWEHASRCEFKLSVCDCCQRRAALSARNCKCRTTPPRIPPRTPSRVRTFIHGAAVRMLSQQLGGIGGQLQLQGDGKAHSTQHADWVLYQPTDLW